MILCIIVTTRVYETHACKCGPGKAGGSTPICPEYSARLFPSRPSLTTVAARSIPIHIKTRVNLTINYFLPQNTQSKYTGPMKKHVYKCILLSLPLVQRVILNLFGRNYNQQTLHFLLILKLRLMASINTLFFCYKPIQVATVPP